VLRDGPGAGQGTSHSSLRTGLTGLCQMFRATNQCQAGTDGQHQTPELSLASFGPPQASNWFVHSSPEFPSEGLFSIGHYSQLSRPTTAGRPEVVERSRLGIFSVGRTVLQELAAGSQPGQMARPSTGGPGGHQQKPLPARSRSEPPRQKPEQGSTEHPPEAATALSPESLDPEHWDPGISCLEGTPELA